MLHQDNLTTLQSHILNEAERFPQTTGQFTWILSALSLATKVIASKIRRARIDDVLGALESSNVQGERQQKLDVIANETLLRCLGTRTGVAIVASEENEEPMILRQDTGAERGYCVLFDPLDGSSNLDCAGAVGTIFSILRHDRRAKNADHSLLQSGVEQCAAGYILYGSSAVFVLTTGNGVNMFVLDPNIGAFVLVAQDVVVPRSAKIYSTNEGNCLGFPDGIQCFLRYAHENGYSTRYSGAMVADVHRILLHGGVFLYPPTAKSPDGKLRLMYEANPMAFIIEQAGGKAFAGKQRILEITPKTLHQRTSVVLGSADEVDRVLSYL